jgi:hypothetical protein
MQKGSKIPKLIIAFALISLPFLSECSKTKKDSLRQDALKLAENYAKDQLKDPRMLVMKDGTITISDSEKRYIIEPARAFTGNIDADEIPDAVVSIVSFHGMDLLLNEHLVMLNTNGKLLLIRAVESDMKILGIKDRLIIADVPTHSRNSPLFNCPKCREVIKYKFVNGELQKAE